MQSFKMRHLSCLTPIGMMSMLCLGACLGGPPGAVDAGVLGFVPFGGSDGAGRLGGDSGAAGPDVGPKGPAGQRGDGGASEADAAAGGDGDARPAPDAGTCDCRALEQLPPPLEDADGLSIPRCVEQTCCQNISGLVCVCTSGTEMLVFDGYECIAGRCSAVLAVTTCANGCRISSLSRADSCSPDS